MVIEINLIKRKHFGEIRRHAINGRNYILLLLLVILSSGYAQENLEILNVRLQKEIWPALWVSHPTASLYDYGVFHFRKTFRIEDIPSRFVVHVSGDNRYRLFVNGEYVCIGPSRGDVAHWRFETVDIASFLKKGDNVLAAEVWNFGEYRPVAQFTFQTGFMLQADLPAHDFVNTNSTWKVLKNESHSPEVQSIQKLNTYFVVGPGVIIDGKKYPWGWEQNDFDDATWENVKQIERAKLRGFGTDGKWMLVPRTIPFMENKLVRFAKIRKRTGVSVSEKFLRGNEDIEIPPHTTGSILLDQAWLTTAYPEMIVSNGKGSKITVSYAESLFESEGSGKGNRDEVEGKLFRGNSDIFYPDGNENRLFKPLWFRTYRYVLIEFETDNDPLTIHEYYGLFTAYPFQERASFESSEPGLNAIWQTGWRTARLCAGETYYDCPYYEQLQYVGDTRIQALISMYVAGDDRLMRKSLTAFDDSRIADGLTQSRYPAYKRQIIPPYSLFWVDMVYDFWMHRPDEKFVSGLLPGVQSVLAWFENRLTDQYMLGPLEWWNFVDWADEWSWDPDIGNGGVPAGVREGNSSILSLQYAYALDYATLMFNAFGNKELAGHYSRLSEKIKKAVYDLCWDEERQLIADTPEKDIFSQHANIMAILTNTIPDGKQHDVLNRTLSDSSLIQATFYFKFYLFRAIKKTGMADRYFELLEPWFVMLDKGLTTFAEKPDPVRSDCHAWSASPNYDLLALVAGITPSAPGFKKVAIAPALGNLEYIRVAIPHPQGMLRIDLAKTTNNGIRGSIRLPPGITGNFVWSDTTIVLQEGLQEIMIE